MRTRDSQKIAHDVAAVGNDIEDPDKARMLNVEVKGRLKMHGLTELFT